MKDSHSTVATPRTKVSKKLLWTSMLVVVVTVGVTYFPFLRIQFLGEIWNFIEWAAKLTLPQYLVRAFDPRVQIIEYRPLRDMIFYGNYLVFGVDPAGYHVSRLVVHIANVLLLFAIALRISRNIRVAVVGAIIYGGIPVYFQTIYSPVDPQPETGIFYLLGTLAWIHFLEKPRKTTWLLTTLAFVLALLGKESNVMFPGTLFLLDRLVIRKPVALKKLIARYFPFAVILFGYLAIEAVVQSNGLFIRTLGFGIGVHAIYNFGQYVALWAFPWGVDSSWTFVWAAVVILTFIVGTIKFPSPPVLFISLCTGLLILPYVWFPQWLFNPRYLYLPTMTIAVLIAGLFEKGWIYFGARRLLATFLALLIAYITLVNGSGVARASADWQEMIRRTRLPFHDIALRHPSFEKDTYLYFIDPPDFRDLSGALFARYGDNVSAGSSTDQFFMQTILYPVFQRVGAQTPTTGAGAQKFAGLRNHKASFVYFFDEAGSPIEVQTRSDEGIHSIPILPASFSIPIRLEGYEVTDNTLRADRPLVLILYWRATQIIDQDYTIFVHLTDANGKLIEGYDNQPLNGKLPTHSWRPGEQVVDGIPIIIPSSVPSGPGYWLEVGLYNWPTMERVIVFDHHGFPLADKIVIGPFGVESIHTSSQIQIIKHVRNGEKSIPSTSVR